MATKTKPPKDAISLLKKDHATVRELLDELEKAAMNDGSEAESLLETIEAELQVHTTIEEEIFYPAFREAATRKDDTKLYYEAVEEHHVVDMVLPEIDKDELQTLGEQLARRKQELKAAGGSADAGGEEDDED
jgi:iron-sulfur cluster repair protein YtfE (RIC family)